MSNRLNDAMGKLNIEGSRNSMGRPPPSPANKRNSGMDPQVINAMFPDAAAAIAKKKAEYTQQTGNAPTSNRNSVAIGDRTSLVTPTISTPAENSNKEALGQPPSTPWGQRHAENRPKSSSGQQPMGQFSQGAPSAGLRSPRPLQLSGSNNLQSTNAGAADGNNANDLPALSPYNMGNASWASMTNTPMVPNFGSQQATQADMVANATAMKLAALSTVNNRIALDDVRKYRRARSSEGDQPLSPGLPGTSVLVVNENGQVLGNQPVSTQQLAALQAQQQAQAFAQRSRPNSPGLAMQGANYGGMGFAAPQSNGYLAAYDGGMGMNGGMNALNLGHFGIGHGGGHEGYISDHSEMRGRSPRGRRGTSKPPEDPTDPILLQDIPGWLRSLRLHKYTDNLKDMKWNDLVELDDKGLEDRGVNALGARRKMLKVSRSFLANTPSFPRSNREPGLRGSQASEIRRKAMIHTCGIKCDGGILSQARIRWSSRRHWATVTRALCGCCDFVMPDQVLLRGDVFCPENKGAVSRAWQSFLSVSWGHDIGSSISDVH